MPPDSVPLLVLLSPMASTIKTALQDLETAAEAAQASAVADRTKTQTDSTDATRLPHFCG